MPFQRFGNEDDDAWRRSRAHLSPAQIDQSVRSALHMCWMMIAPSKRTTAEVERQFRRIVDRAIKDMEEDDEAFA